MPTAGTMHIILADHNKKMVDAWNSVFTAETMPSNPDVQVSICHGSALELRAEAIVSPANSFGFMRGGIDAALLEYFGESVEQKVRGRILSQYGGELLVGQAFDVSTGHPVIPILICAPTMRVPMELPHDTINPFLATRAVMRLVRMSGIESVVFSGMGTGAGRVPHETCAKQMFHGIFDVAVFPRVQLEMMENHYKLVNPSSQ